MKYCSVSQYFMLCSSYLGSMRDASSTNFNVLEIACGVVVLWEPLQ